jgi:membrane protein DedA with SNARE-associated domain
MILTAEFSTLLHEAAGNKLLQASAIIAGTFILEDAATLLAAMQVASGAVLLPVALGALYAGIILGDLALYGLGRASTRNRWARRLVPRKRRNLGRQWATNRMIPIVLVSRFVPGLRLPTYTTLGFLKAPFSKFAAAAILATMLWTTGLFFVSLKIGVLLMRYLGVWRWAGLMVFGAILLGVGRFATSLYKKRSQE